MPTRDIGAVMSEHVEQLMRLPNVIGVGVGKETNKTVLKVFVTQKLPTSSLQPEEIVPKFLDGYETDVEEIGIVTQEAR